MRTGRPILRLVLLPLLIAGCGALMGPAPDRSRLYVLTPISAERVEVSGGAPSLSIGPVRLPSYLDRAEVMIRTSANELRPDPLGRWAEPLEDSFKDALAQNLGTLLGTDRIATSPWYGTEQATYRVAVRVQRFEPNTDQTATLVARWIVQRRRDERVEIARESRYTRDVEADTTGAAVDALSACVADLSREIAAAIRQLE